MTRMCRRAGAWPGGRGRSLRGGMAFLAGVLCLALVCCIALESACLAAVIPDAVWQDNDRNHRRSPSQIKRQLRSPEVRAARLPLDGAERVGSGNEDASVAAEQAARAARVRAQIAQAPAPPGEASDLQMLGQNDWRLKIENAAVALNDSVFLGDIATPLGHMDEALWQ